MDGKDHDIVAVVERMDKIIKQLAHIELLLQYAPEIQAVCNVLELCRRDSLFFDKSKYPDLVVIPSPQER